MAKKKVALISGITGQDGAYLAHLLLKKGYVVHGVKRRSSQFNTQRVDHIYEDLQNPNAKFYLHYGDLVDSTNIIRIVQETMPDEIYNLGAQSHVKVSFEMPEYTADADGIGALRFLEAIRILGMEKKTKFYQASTSELFGKVMEVPQSETTPFYPRSPYGVAKLYAFWITVNYREAYGIYAANGILFNHESPLRGETFVTRKITRAAARISLGVQDCVYVGNLDAKRDWGHAREYVEGMWRMLQQEKADDYVLATNKTTPVREFLTMAFAFAGIDVRFSGSGVNEVAKCKKTGNVVMRVDPEYYRPTEVDLLIGNADKAWKNLKWRPAVSVEDLCKEMVAADMYRTKIEIGQLPPNSAHIEKLVHDEDGFLTWFEQKVA